MIKRIAAITFIFLCTAFAWAILGATIFQRTYDSDSQSGTRVESTWGAPQNQTPPIASFEEFVPKKTVKTENGKTVETVVQEKFTRELPLESSRLNADLNLEHRQKGLLWYSTYKVGFAGAYAFRNTSDKEQDVTFALYFPTAQAIYDDLVFTVDDAPLTLKNEKNSASGTREDRARQSRDPEGRLQVTGSERLVLQPGERRRIVERCRARARFLVEDDDKLQGHRFPEQHFVAVD